MTEPILEVKNLRILFKTYAGLAAVREDFTWSWERPYM